MDTGAGLVTALNPVGFLAAGQSTILTIQFTIDPSFMGTEIINYAEIANADDDTDSTNEGPTDIDSEPDTDDTNDSGGEPGGDTDDTVNGENGDEDDHDPELFEVQQSFDLALIKQVLSPGPFAQGDDVTYNITIENQGTLDAFNIEVTDYIPTGLTLNDFDWIDNGNGTATTFNPIVSLPAGQSTSITITMTVDPNFMGTSLMNFAEISSADDDMDPNNTYPTDDDSEPDNNPGNDGDFVDDDTSNTNGDEDDHDPAEITIEQIYDLALVKTISSAGPFMAGDEVTYIITVINQGTLAQ